MYNQKDLNEYIKWQKDNGKAKYQLTTVVINDNGEIKTEKIMAWVMNTSPDDWKEFCKDTGKEYEGEVKLLAYC